MLSVKEKIAALRNEMQKEHIAAYYIPTDDFHGSEYVCDYFKCREYMSSFTGSAGSMVVTQDFAGLWTDGRYFLQAKEQLSDTGIELMKDREPGVLSIPEFLSKKLQSGDILGFDGRCVNAGFVEKLKEAFAKEEKKLAMESRYDLVDRVWEDRPKLVFHPVWELPMEKAGVSAADKIAAIRADMKKLRATVHILTSLEDIAWVLNLRGNDIHCDPVFLSYLVITAGQCMLFADADALKGIDLSRMEGMELRSYNDIYSFVTGFNNQRVLLNESIVNAALLQAISQNHNEIINRPNPSELKKAIKNKTELKNIREAHIFDGVAVTKFLFFLKNYRDAVRNGVWTEPLLTEMQLAEILLKYRKQNPQFLEESFDPIMAYGPHGAIVHYSATKETDAAVGAGSFLLSDTGAHYMCGTTDITRTVAMAGADELTDEQKKHYTLVLKSHLNLLGAKFVKGVTGYSLDAIAREPLWREGLDFNHGTGHGVGYILSVHEGPNAFRTPRGNTAVSVTAMEPGMVTSDEPGLYIEGKYGIRLESLIECVEEGNGVYGFRPLTFVPFDRDAIDEKLLNFAEKTILNTYHRQVCDRIGLCLNKEEYDWLCEVTRPIL